MAWTHWEGERRAGPRPRWKGWAGKVEIQRLTGDADLLLLDDVGLYPRAIFSVIGEGANRTPRSPLRSTRSRSIPQATRISWCIVSKMFDLKSLAR
jgi:hypothetical protein